MRLVSFGDRRLNRTNAHHVAVIYLSGDKGVGPALLVVSLHVGKETLCDSTSEESPSHALSALIADGSKTTWTT